MQNVRLSAVAFIHRYLFMELGTLNTHLAEQVVQEVLEDP